MILLRQPQHGRSAAFTIVELLVVIAIIAVLIGILMPAIRLARSQALLVDCQGRMRAQLQAHAVYSTDYRDQKPPLAIATPMLSMIGWMSPTVRFLNLPVGQGILVFEGYLSRESLYDHLDFMQEDADNDRWMWDNCSISGSSYWYYWKDPYDTGQVTYQKCWAKGNKALVLETNADPDPPFVGVMPAGGWTAHPVVNRMNIGYGDGSVRSFPANEVRLRTSSGTSDRARMLDYYNQANRRY